MIEEFSLLFSFPTCNRDRVLINFLEIALSIKRVRKFWSHCCITFSYAHRTCREPRDLKSPFFPSSLENVISQRRLQMTMLLRDPPAILILGGDVLEYRNVCSRVIIWTLADGILGANYRRRRNVARVSRDQRRGPSRSPVARCFPLRRRLSNVSGPALPACQQVPMGSGLENLSGRGHE